MKVKAKTTFRTEIDGKLYQRGNEYEIAKELFEKWKTHFTSIEPAKSEKKNEPKTK